MIGRYTQGKKGPVLLCIGGIHGNEPAGIEALELILKMLEVEPITNPDFEFRGTLVALRGNVGALEQDARFLDRDLNRIWQDTDQVNDREASERAQLKNCIEAYIESGEEVVLLDLHTTTATGGIFTFPMDALGRMLAVQLGAPVILGVTGHLLGTCAAYFQEKHDNVTSLVFEGGQHLEEASTNRMIAAIVSALRAIGCVEARHIEHQHDHILTRYSEGLPAVSSIVYRHPIVIGDGFVMNPGYQNFDAIEQGEVVARAASGPIKAPLSGLILMPHYQEQGTDGFFIIQQEEESDDESFVHSTQQLKME